MLLTDLISKFGDVIWPATQASVQSAAFGKGRLDRSNGHRLDKSAVDRFLGKPAAIKERTYDRCNDVCAWLIQWYFTFCPCALDHSIERRGEAFVEFGLRGRNFRIALRALMIEG